ncbi:MAG: polysaccharide deacetylase family protein [Desulfitobacteriia bacterium]|jgi:peptidoglycan/xylan/chitin deacetylase (PgdA/CDA1 family)
MFPELLYLFLAIVFGGLALYLLLPEVFLHFLGIGSWKRQYSPGVVLTFDDGPDPNYTPRLLTILARQNIKACFFLNGEKAAQYPEIVKRILEEGHLIGSHGYVHKHAWLMSPWKTWALWDRGISTLENITGQKVHYVRSPWGSANLAFFFWCIKRKKRLVAWNVHGMDWLKKRSPAQIINRIIRRTKEGSIILLHDSGGQEGAPENTLSCLDELCHKIREDLKLPIVPLTFPPWSWRRRLTFSLWEKWEQLYVKIYNIERIDHLNLFRLKVSRYRGPDLIHPDGQVMATKGDLVGEIHFDNLRFQSVGPDLQKTGLRALKLALRSLPDLAKYIANNPKHQNIKVYLGLTLINRGVKKLGFNVQEYPGRDGRLVALFQKIIVHIYHPSGGKRNTASLGKTPKIVWISKKELLERYNVEKYS